MLLPEEQYIMKWMSQYRVLELQQINHMMKGSAEGFVTRSLNRLAREGYLFKDWVYAYVEPNLPVDQKMLDAIWVMLRFSNNIEPLAHYPAQYPSQVFFIKDQSAYEIIVLEKDEAHIIRLLQPDDGIKYIILLRDINMAERLKLPNAPCIFATIARPAGEDVRVKFYGGK